MNYDITKEDLGDWKIHATNGSVDNLADSEEDAVWQTRRFLSYLPPSVFEVQDLDLHMEQNGRQSVGSVGGITSLGPARRF